jgi:hypothetical protein
MPGAGKSTVTGLAARSLPRAAQVKGDDVNQMIQTGWVWFLGKPTDDAVRHYELCKRNMCALASNFVDFGFTVFMDTVVSDRAELDFLVALMSPRPVRLVVLAPGIAACRERNAGRDPDEQFDFDGYDELERDMTRGFGDAGWWFDTAALTPEETAEQVVREAAERAGPIDGGWETRLRRLHEA